MPDSNENEWTIIDPTNTMASTDNNTSSPAAEPRIEVTINTKPAAMSTNDKEEGTENASPTIAPKTARRDSIDSNISDERDDYHRRAPRRSGYRRDFIPASPSPTRSRHRTPTLSSSTHLLEQQVSKYDGVANLPFPARGSIYITTYPMTDKDVKKWSWLFSRNIEDKYLSRGRSLDYDAESDNDDGYVSRRRLRRDRSPFYDATIDIPSVYLSRALDTDVVPENTADVSYLIVTQNRHQPMGSKLQVVESRKAAGIVMYYEALRGDSVVFVGAVVGWGGERVKTRNFKRVENLEEATTLKVEGKVGIIC
jgi:hypothetical protein